MYNNNANRVLGTISAMQTFTENFPMSILDLLKGPRYTNMFQFIMALLNACGVDSQKVVKMIISKVFEQPVDKIEGGIDSVYDAIANMNVDEQGKFMEAMEYSVKGILMALLSGIFSCSAIPILPDGYMDLSYKMEFDKDDFVLQNVLVQTNKNVLVKLEGKSRFDIIKKKFFEEWYFDTNEPMDSFKISDDVWAVSGYTNSAQTEEVMVNISITKDSDNNPLLHCETNNGQTKDFPLLPEFPWEKILIQPKLNIPIGNIDIFDSLYVSPLSKEGRFYYACEGKDNYYQKVETTEMKTYQTGEVIFDNNYEDYVKLYVAFATSGSDRSKLKFKLTKPINQDINLKTLYLDKNNEEQVIERIIKKGEQESQPFIINPGTSADDGEAEFIVHFYFNDVVEPEDDDEELPKCFTGFGKTFVYLDRQLSRKVEKSWNRVGNESFAFDPGFAEESDGTTSSITPSVITREETVYKYVLINTKPEEYTRVDVVKTSGVTVDDPEYIVCYEGIDPNLLYQTYDMNAFIWYVLNQGSISPQFELNKMMWDNRRWCRKHDVIRSGSTEWNRWYNSKPTDRDDLNYTDDKDPQHIMHPIAQLRRGDSGDMIRVDFPAQHCYKPKATSADTTFVFNNIRQNMTLYQYNWEYLNNIQIFNPKLLLMKLFDSLLNGALTAAMGLRPNISKNNIKALLASAIVKYIEAEDMEVEDCYFEFSNEEYATMLEDMLLNRYRATRYNGEVNVVKEHDIDEYFDTLDSVNQKAVLVEQTEIINRMLTEVSVTEGNEGSIDYGLSMDYDGKWYEAFLFALVEPIVESLFTPQVMLLFMANFNIMGITSFEDVFEQDMDKMINVLLNKIFNLIKSIISYIKDKLAELMYDMFYEYVLPVLQKYTTIVLLEKIERWRKILQTALASIPIYMPMLQKTYSQIDEVTYADIKNNQALPESQSKC